jgi:hypothetical protein
LTSHFEVENYIAQDMNSTSLSRSINFDNCFFFFIKYLNHQ